MNPDPDQIKPPNSDGQPEKTVDETTATLLHFLQYLFETRNNSFGTIEGKIQEGNNKIKLLRHSTSGYIIEYDEVKVGCDHDYNFQHMQQNFG